MSNVKGISEKWIVCQIGDIAQLYRGITYHKERAKDIAAPGYVPLLRATNIQQGRLELQQLVYVPEDLVSPEQFVTAGDVILAMSSGSADLVGKSAVSGGSFNGSFGAFCGLLRPSTEIESAYLGAFLRSTTFRKVITSLSKGTNINNLKREHVLSAQIPLPPKNEQRRIVAKIEALFSELDKGVESLTTARAQLKTYRQALLKHAFEGRLTEQWRREHADELESAEQLLARIREERAACYRQQLEYWEAEVARWETAGKYGQRPPKPTLRKKLPPITAEEHRQLPDLPKEWCWARLGTCADRVTVGHVGPMKDEYVESGVPFLRSLNVRPNRFDAENLKYVSREFHESLRKSALEPGDVVVVRSGNVGTACEIPNEVPEANCSDLVIIKGLIKTLPRLVAHYMNWQAEGAVKAHSVGVALTHFNTKSVEAFPFPIMPLREQEQLLELLEARMSQIRQLEETIDTALQQAEALRQSILKRAFDGRLVPQDPNDEPAADLLARIRAERQAQPKGRRARGRKELEA